MCKPLQVGIAVEGGNSTGGGELAAGVETSILSLLSPILLPALSLGFWSLLSCIDTSLLELSDVPSASADVADPFQPDSSQVWPVKLRN